MAQKVFFQCPECGYKSPRWMGRCPGCNSWNTFVEGQVVNKGDNIHNIAGSNNRVAPVPITGVLPLADDRFSVGLAEMDRVLGGGIVPGSLVLLGGDPGIGKSTILLQVAGNMTNKRSEPGKVLYVSGEESLQQIRLRADRLGLLNDSIYLVAETEIAIIENYIMQLKPNLVIIDSIQTTFHNDLSSTPGSVSQVRESTLRLMRIAKGLSISVIIIGHVTKEGMLAGPRVLEHMVDVVLYMEGQRHQSLRLLRVVKNRFGSTNEVGVFEMQGAGLVEVSNPSSLFMGNFRNDNLPGTVVVPVMEGTRPLLVEIQALVCATCFGIPRRMTTGVDTNRVALIMAVLEKRLGMQMGKYDAYVNVVGGIKINETAVDLGIAISLASSFKNCPVEHSLAVMGEIGLTGEIRAIPGVERRIDEARRLGFKRCMVPYANTCKASFTGIYVDGVRSTIDAIDRALKV